MDAAERVPLPSRATRNRSLRATALYCSPVNAPPLAVAIIPARYASTRFPGKPLAAETGKPLIQHVVERVRRAIRVSRVLVATDDRRIADAVAAFGGHAVMTRDDHPNGTCRLAEVAAGLEPRDAQLIVNVQGDEPEIEPAVIDRLVDALAADFDAPMATVASPFADDEDPDDPHIVKVVLDQRGRALYFSRCPIPFVRHDAAPPQQAGEAPAHLKHLGIYAYRRDFLLRYPTLPATPLEQTERLEQLRALEHGYAIATVVMPVRHHGIDTPEQYAAFVARCRATAT